MEERAPGGEVLRRPIEWLELLSFRGHVSDDEAKRTARMPPLPMTRFEYFEKLAFAKEKES